MVLITKYSKIVFSACDQSKNDEVSLFRTEALESGCLLNPYNKL